MPFGEAIVRQRELLEIDVRVKRRRSVMDFRNTRISLSRPVSSYAKVRALISALRRNRRRQFAQACLMDRRYLDIGCGPNVHPLFVNLDYDWHPGIDIVWDITKGLPFPDGRFDGIFTEHCLEHIRFASVDMVMRECHRILRPGGTLRIVVPDGELYLRRYVSWIDGMEESFPCSKNDSYEGTYSPIMSVNRIFRSHGHLFIYDFDLLAKLLARNWFCDIRKVAYASGRDEILLRDSESRKPESLYVEATKSLAGAKS